MFKQNRRHTHPQTRRRQQQRAVPSPLSSYLYLANDRVICFRCKNRVMNTLLHLVVVAATAKVSNSVADAADVGPARKKITHWQCLGVTLGKKKKKKTELAKLHSQYVIVISDEWLQLISFSLMYQLHILKHFLNITMHKI